MPGEFLLGYDAREMWTAPTEVWDEQRRKNFLYRLDVEKPLSLDWVVWASVFDTHEDLLPEDIGVWDDEVWENLHALEACLANRRLATKPFYVVAFAILTAPCSHNEQVALVNFVSFLQAGKSPGGAERIRDREGAIADPSSIDKNWTLLGYEVITIGPISGLANMGVGEPRARWEPHLNRFHLFDDLLQATEFKDYCTVRVPEHVPFFVSGIWLIRENVGETV